MFFVNFRLSRIISVEGTMLQHLVQLITFKLFCVTPDNFIQNHRDCMQAHAKVCDVLDDVTKFYHRFVKHVHYDK